MIRIWKFETAPPEVCSLLSALCQPRWVMLIPRLLHGPDVEAEIRRRVGATLLERAETADGDVVYFGMTEVAPLLASGLPEVARQADLDLR